jgi:glycosyltransferase involved in cell wall biosynthesis
MGELVRDSQLREQMGERGLKRAERFSVAAMIEKLDQVYGELLEQNTAK